MRESWAFIGIKGKKVMSEMRRDRKTRVQSGRTWIVRTRKVRKTVMRRVHKRVIRGRTVYRTVRRVRIRVGRSAHRRSLNVERCSGRRCSGYRGMQTKTRKGHTC